MAGKSTPTQKHTDKYTLQAGLEPTSEEILPLSALEGLSGTVQGQAVFLHIWNPTSMDWEKYKGVSVYAENLTVSMDDMEKLGADFYWPRVKLYYAGNNVDYVCKNTDIDALETDTDWYVWKLVYSGNNMIDKEGPRQGAVDSKPSGLPWNI